MLHLQSKLFKTPTKLPSSSCVIHNVPKSTESRKRFISLQPTLASCSSLSSQNQTLYQKKCNHFTTKSLLQPPTRRHYNYTAIHRSSPSEHHVLQERKRKMEVNLEQRQGQYIKLLNKSKYFLGNYKDTQNSVSYKTMTINQLVSEWNAIWGSPSESFTFLNINTPSQDNAGVTLESVEIVDELVHKLLDEVEEMLSQNKAITAPLYSIVSFGLGGWAKAPPTDMNGIKAQQIIDRIEYIHGELDKSKSLSLQPSTILYGAAIRAWTNSIDSNVSEGNGASMACKLLEKMENIYSNGENPSAKPNLRVYNTCLHGLAKRGMIVEAERFIEKMEKLNDEELIPDVYTYSICMNAYEKFNGNNMKGKPVEKHAKQLLTKMLKKYEQTGDRRFMPNQFTYGTVLSVLSKSRYKDGAVDADRILRGLIDLYEKESLKPQFPKSLDELDPYPLLQPTIEHFRTVFLAYSTRKDKKIACKRIGELLVEMERLNDAGLSEVKPTYELFIIYLDVLVKSNERDAEEKANQVLSRMKELYLQSQSTFVMNNYGYNLLMHAIGRSFRGGRSERAEAIMKQMNDLYIKTGNEALLPDKVTYTSLLKAIMEDRVPGFAAKCKSILEKMELEYSSNGNDKLKPDVYTYGTVMNAIAYEGYPEDCEALLDRMESLASKGDTDCYPNVICFNTVMSAYGKRRRSDSALQTERIFRRINESREKGNNNLEYNAASYAIYIDALARSNEKDKVSKAEAVMKIFLEHYEKTKYEGLVPTANVWCALMLCYAESSDIEDKAEKALNVVKRMEQTGTEVDIISYNTVLKACSKSNSGNERIRKRVLEISQIALAALRNREGLKLDSYSYNSLLWISHKFIDDPEEKVATIKALFNNCCNDGEVNKLVFDTLKRVAPRDLFSMLVGNDKDLPAEWTRNAGRFRRK